MYCVPKVGKIRSYPKKRVKCVVQRNIVTSSRDVIEKNLSALRTLTKSSNPPNSVEQTKLPVSLPGGYFVMYKNIKEKSKNTCKDCRASRKKFRGAIQFCANFIDVCPNHDHVALEELVKMQHSCLKILVKT